MQCDLINKHIDQEISDQEFEKHMQTCSYCSEMNMKINEVLSILEIKVPDTGSLVAKTLNRLDTEKRRKPLIIDLSTILQFASVIVAGIFLGILLGKNSDTASIMSKGSKKERAIIEYCESHHLGINDELF